MSRKLRDSIESGFRHDWIAFQSIFETDCILNLELEERMHNPVTFAAEMMGEIMYFHQAMQQEDSDEFVDAVVKEINGDVDNKSWELVNIEDVPKDAEIIHSVWFMRRKRNLVTYKITKYKARLNIHGDKQTIVINYWETYAPMVTWFCHKVDDCLCNGPRLTTMAS